MLNCSLILHLVFHTYRSPVSLVTQKVWPRWSHWSVRSPYSNWSPRQPGHPVRLGVGAHHELLMLMGNFA